MNTQHCQTLIKIIAASLTLFTVNPSFAQDSDGDGVLDIVDNCSQLSNPAQIDVDADLFGNRCDFDFNNDGNINFIDYSQLIGAFLTVNPMFDVNSDGIVNYIDISMFVPYFNGTPGPGATGATYAVDVQPILATKCTPCHTGLGFGGHNIAITYTDALNPANHATCVGLNVGQCALVRLRAGQMPPNAGCTGNPVTDAGNASCLNYNEQNLVFSWINGGLAP